MVRFPNTAIFVDKPRSGSHIREPCMLYNSLFSFHFLILMYPLAELNQRIFNSSNRFVIFCS